MDKKYAQHLMNKTKEDYNLISKDFSDTRYFVWSEFNMSKDYIKDGERILDLGCGNGRLIELFKEKNIEYIGIDNSEKLINIAKEKCATFKNVNFKFIVADVLNLPFEDNYFDKIFSVAVLHHIPSEEYRLQSLKEVKRVLKNNGILVLSVWNLWRRTKTLKLLIKDTILKILGKSKLDFKDIFVPWQNKILRYLHCFTKKELINLIKKAGFKIKKFGNFQRGETKNYNLFLIAEK